MMYKLYKTDPRLDHPNAVMSVGVSPQVSFIFDPANPDYQTFKQQINDETAQLEDADGNLMSPEAAKAYVATLP